MIDEQKIAEVHRGNTQESQMAAYLKGILNAATIRAMDAVLYKKEPSHGD
jgi:hypothetical protein